MSRKFILISVAVTATIIVVIVAAYLMSYPRNWQGVDIALTQETGNSIVHALHRYQEQHKNYPDTLSELLPSYITMIENPKVGNKKWDYVREHNGFYLGVSGVNEEADPVLYITSSSNEWLMDTK